MGVSVYAMSLCHYVASDGVFSCLPVRGRSDALLEEAVGPVRHALHHGPERRVLPVLHLPAVAREIERRPVGVHPATEGGPPPA